MFRCGRAAWNQASLDCTFDVAAHGRGPNDVCPKRNGDGAGLQGRHLGAGRCAGEKHHSRGSGPAGRTQKLGVRRTTCVAKAEPNSCCNIAIAPAILRPGGMFKIAVAGASCPHVEVCIGGPDEAQPVGGLRHRLRFTWLACPRTVLLALQLTRIKT
jgi:hypothetical protein